MKITNKATVSKTNKLSMIDITMDNGLMLTLSACRLSDNVLSMGFVVSIGVIVIDEIEVETFSKTSAIRAMRVMMDKLDKRMESPVFKMNRSLSDFLHELVDGSSVEI